MLRQKPRINSVVVAIVAVCLLSFPAPAQQSGPRASVSDDDLMRLNQQIKELKNATFRAFLRMRLVSWEPAEPAPSRRQAAMEVATQGVTDLCEHQDEVWPPTASWLHRILVNQIKILQSPADTAPAICALKTDTKDNPEKNFASAIKMLSNPETSAAGLNQAKSVILSGQVTAEAMLGELLRLNAARSPHLPELLNAVLALEQKQPRTLRLQILPFFTSMFLDKSVAPEIATRFLFVAVRSSRLSPEELANPVMRSSATTVLNGIVIAAQSLAPQLYPEITSLLRSMNPISAKTVDARIAAEERIQKASDQLEQLVWEANSVSDEHLKTYFLSRAARLAKEQGQFVKAVDLATMTPNNSTWLTGFLSDIVSDAVNKKSPRDATYAISKLTTPLQRARSFRLLGEYYGENQDKIKSKEAFAQSVKELKAVDNNNEKANAFLILAASVLKYEPADAYEAFRESVRTINNLPVAATANDTVKLLPVAEQLIRSFRLLATHENETATSLAAEIKFSELRLAALTGAYSARQTTGLRPPSRSHLEAANRR